MKVSKRAKEKWFKENMLEFEIYYFDAVSNERIVKYDIDRGLRLSWPYSLEGKQLFAKARTMTPSEIFFKYKKLGSDSNETGLKLAYFLMKDV